MPSKFVIIIFLLLAVWQVIGSLVEKASKKQQEERLKKQSQASPQQQTAPRRHPGTTRASTTVVDRAGELAARRKGQLEELRGRRAGRQQPAAAPAGSSLVTLRPTLPTARPPATAGRTAPQAIPIGRAVRPPRPAPAPPAPRPQARPAPGTTPKLTSQRPQSQSKAEYDRSLHALERAKSVKKSAPAPTATTTGRHLRLPGLADEPIGPEMLRKMVIYREILDAPLALRDQQTWERW